MILIIGSYALQFYNGRIPTMDIDFIAPLNEGMAFLKSFHPEKIMVKEKGNKFVGVCNNAKFFVEFEVAWPDSNNEQLLKIIEADPTFINREEIFNDIPVVYANSDILYHLKMSHRFKKNSPHFYKTMDDILHLRQKEGCTLLPELNSWYKRREKETYAYAHPNLNTDKKSFFNPETVTYKYDHDSIHEAIKVLDKPAYSYFKPDESEVFCDKGMFFDLPVETRNYAVYEESCVLALERSLIPFPQALTAPQAFAKALNKVCTSITSGWFRDWSWENHNAVLKMEEDFRTDGKAFEKLFETGIANGVVKEFA